MLNTHHSSKQLGFTLIELMLTAVIIATISAIAMPSYRALVINSEIRATAESIRAGMQVARAEAVKRNANVRFTLAGRAWTVGCVTATANCPSTIQAKDQNEGSSSAITTTITPNGTTIATFNSFGAITGTGQIRRVTVDSSALPASATGDLAITLGTGGNPRICDPNVTATTDVKFCS
jgi:type IV fimbrial biogenesis protein FimT